MATSSFLGGNLAQAETHFNLGYPSAMLQAMGVCLISERDGERLSCNWWNWRPTVELLRRHDLPADPEARAIVEATDGDILTLNETEALRAADIVGTLLERLPMAGRALLDGTVTSEADDGTLFRGAETDKNYSATRAWLGNFREFCLRCGGFTAS